MIKRFITICLVIAAAIAGLIILGNVALRMHADSLRMERQNQFVSVAEQIRLDVKRKLDDFIAAEQKRPYTDYLPLYVPETANQAAALVRSPLADSLSNGLAYGYFQIDPDENIILPYQPAPGAKKQPENSQLYIQNLRSNLLPAFGGNKFLDVERLSLHYPQFSSDTDGYSYADRIDRAGGSTSDDLRQRKITLPSAQQQATPQTTQTSTQQAYEQNTQKSLSKTGKYAVRSFEETPQQVQVVQQQRQAAELNVRNAPAAMEKAETEKTAKAESPTAMKESVSSDLDSFGDDAKTDARKKDSSKGVVDGELHDTPSAMPGMAGMPGMPAQPQPQIEDKFEKPQETIQVRIEPFAPLLVPYSNRDSGVFSGQVFLLRHIQIEKTHLLQGFQLNQTELLNQVKDSASRFLRQGMGFDVSRNGRPDAAYTAILDFGFGELGLHLLEQDAAYVGHRISLLSNWFYAITAVVAAAVMLAMFSLWRSLNEQLRLSRKKDDFISAVSHELRTPLTSIRMYAEMLENNWISNEQKRLEYYAGMRQETERLSRLIENVLDFSRIQRGKKHYQFSLGDVNECLAQAARMMEPCAKKAGFELHTEFASLSPFAFDRDAVMQIAINLIDNACKYARPAADNRIILRTRRQNDHVLIEVEDHGPGVPRAEQNRIFDAFYRCADESTRQTTGTGLGLALVKRFAEAHRGVVDVAQAAPAGCIFRVALPQ
jgi:signal transduction histidine kinase